MVTLVTEWVSDQVSEWVKDKQVHRGASLLKSLIEHVIIVLVDVDIIHMISIFYKHGIDWSLTFIKSNKNRIRNMK